MPWIHGWSRVYDADVVCQLSGLDLLVEGTVGHMGTCGKQDARLAARGESSWPIMVTDDILILHAQQSWIQYIKGFGTLSYSASAWKYPSVVDLPGQSAWFAWELSCSEGLIVAVCFEKCRAHKTTRIRKKKSKKMTLSGPPSKPYYWSKWKRRNYSKYNRYSSKCCPTRIRSKLRTIRNII